MDDFEKAMLGEGVLPLGAKQKGSRGQRRGPPSPPPVRPRAPVDRRRPAAPTPLELARAEIADLKARVERLRAAATEAEAARVEAVAVAAATAKDAAKQAAGRREVDVQREVEKRRVLRDELGAVKTELAAVRAERDDLLGREGLDALFAARGLELDEGRMALGRLLAMDAGWEALRPSPELARVLSERVQLLCGRPGCPADPRAVVIPVSRKRCDVCAGSDLRAAYEAFRKVAEETGTERVTLVGGSPAYRRQLKQLSEELGGPRLDLVSGTRKRDSRKVEADLRRSDVVLVWGGTVLDHAVSASYRGANVVHCGERGMARMLAFLGKSLG